jgi:hypothetical protein
MEEGKTTRRKLRAAARPLSMDVRSTPGRHSPRVPMSARCLLPNEEPAEARFLTRECTGVQTLEKRFKTCHFVPLFGAFGAACGWDASLGKPLQHHEIGPEVSAAEPAQVLLA